MKSYHGKEANRLHQFKIQQERTDANLLNEQRRRLRNALKYGLRRRTSACVTDRRGRLKEWFIKKLDSLVAYGLADWKGVTERQEKIARAYFFEGVGTQQIGLSLALSQRQVQREINQVLNIIIDTAPRTLVMLLDVEASQYILHGCPHCGDTLEWDRDGAHLDGEGEYVGIHCGRRFTFDLKPVGG